MLVQMAISRSREFAADATGAGLSNDPVALAEGLERLHQAIPRVRPLTETGTTAHLMIANPFTGHSSPASSARTRTPPSASAACGRWPLGRGLIARPGGRSRGVRGRKLPRAPTP